MPHSLLQKVTLGVIVVVLVSITITGLATASGLAIRNAFRALTTHGIEHANQSKQFTGTLSRAISEATFFAVTRNPQERTHTEIELQEAQEVLQKLKHGDDHNHTATEADIIELEQRRTALIATTQDEIRRLLRAVETNDSALIEQTIDVLKEINDDLEALEEDSDALVAQENVAASDIMKQALRRGLFTLGGSLAVLILGILLGLLLLRRFIIQPISTLSHTAHAVAAGSLDQAVAVTSSDEIGRLQQAFNHMVANLRAQHRLLDERRINAEEAHATLASAYDQIEEQLETIQSQRNLLRELSVPVLPLTATTLVIPLVGSLDTKRLAMLQQQALQALERTTAQQVILDLTGVPVVDTQVAQGVLQVAQAARLLGAEVIVAGINPAVAQTIVGLGIDVSSVTTRSSLEHAIAYTLTKPTLNGAAIPTR